LNVTSLPSEPIGPGAVWRNEPGVVHSIAALEDAVVLEVSTPELDDVVRLVDRYGRS
jgi:quercetin dioxygenase-like cupin family protein